MRFIVDLGWFYGEPFVLLDARLLSYSPGLLTIVYLSVAKFVFAIGVEI